MNARLIAGLIAALGFATNSPAATSSLSFSNTATDAFITVSGTGRFENVLKLTPSALDSLVMTFYSLSGAYSAVKYTFFTDAALTQVVASTNATGYAIRTLANSTDFTVRDELVPFDDRARTNFNLAATTYYLRLAGTLNDADGALKLTASGAILAAVPEPESYALLLAGLGLIGTIARRRGSPTA